MADEIELGAVLEHIKNFGIDSDALREKRMKSIEEGIAEWASRQWTAEDAPNLVVYEIIELVYSYPKRANDLIKSMRLLVRSNHVVPAVILARALVETVAMGRFFIEKIDKLLVNGDFEKLEMHFLRFYAGSKLKQSTIETVHVNDALRDLEEADLRYVTYLIEKYPQCGLCSGLIHLQHFVSKHRCSKPTII